MSNRIRYEVVNHAIWHHYQDKPTGREMPAIGLRHYYRFHGQPRLDEMIIQPTLVRWGSTDNRALPAQLTFHAWNDKSRSWELVLEKQLPRPPKGKPIAIKLGGVRTEFLRIDCLRQHPVGPSGGEQWASPHYVPFDTLKSVEFLGQPVRKNVSDLPIAPPLRIGRNTPKAVRGQRVFSESDAVMFSSPAFSVGFSLRRPMTTHLGWDSARAGKSAENLLFHRTLQLNFYNPHPLVGPGDLRVLSGPAWNTLGWDAHSRLWGGDVSVTGNIVSYKHLHVEEGLTIDAEFEVRPDGLNLQLRQDSSTDRETLELDAWRFVWKAQAAMIATQGMPRQENGRTGAVDLPAIWAAPGYGNLSVRQVDGDAARLQVESWRKHDISWAGITFREGHASSSLSEAMGCRNAAFEFRVADVLPRLTRRKSKVHPETRRNWGPFLMFRAELAGFSNNAISTNCHLSQTGVTDLAAYTEPPAIGPKPIELARYTATLALKDGRGYGDSREHYQDSDPAVLNMTGRIQQVAPHAEWLADVWPFIRRTAERILSKVDHRGLVAAPLASGNYGNKGHVTNAWDCVNFGHYDGYSTVETYRAFRNTIGLARAAGEPEFAKRVERAAGKMKQAFFPTFYNPKTGWLGSWRSRDGELHDYGHYCVNAPACLYGLVAPAKARQILQRMDARRRELGLDNFRYGLPIALIPIRPGDYQGGYMDNPIWGKGVREDGADGFGIYCNGTLTLCSANYPIRAYHLFGFKKLAEQMAEQIMEGYALGRIMGGVRSGTEFHTFEGIACGYEGPIVLEGAAHLAIAQNRGLVKILEPEFWLG